MRIGVLVSSLGNFGKKDFYNAQEFGLARALDGLCEQVTVFKLVDKDQTFHEERLENAANTVVRYLPSHGYGINGIVDVSRLDRELDALLYFSDTQLSLPAVYRWTRRNGIILIPYIGSVESHSTNRIKKKIINWLFQRNLAVYRKNDCLAKTPDLKAKLEQLGVSRSIVAPVGLDITLAEKNFMSYDPLALKQEYGYDATDKILLFIGRMTEEKRPLEMIELFADLHSVDRSYKLLMVGTGELQASVGEAVKRHGLQSAVRQIDQIPNKEIWKLYRMAECFVNLNRQEIFGMAILEAMYYGCKVVAWRAPGPDFVIEDGVSGCLVDDHQKVFDAIRNQSVDSFKAHQRIKDCFTWEQTARLVLKLSGEKSTQHISRIMLRDL